jgi:tol-pal system protein YbgF
MKKRPAFLFLLALSALAAGPACAGLFDDNEARLRVKELRTDLDALTKRVGQINQNQVDFVNQAEALKTDMANIRGQLEVLLNQIDTIQKRQRDLYVDLDTRLRKLEDATAAAKPAGNLLQEGRDYEAALVLFKAHKFRDANAAFQAFIRAWPNSEMLPSAHYWVASGYYQLKNYAAAADTFAAVALTWPNDAKAPDALLAQSNALTETGDAASAKKVLETLLTQYPNSSAAQTAEQILGKKK